MLKRTSSLLAGISALTLAFCLIGCGGGTKADTNTTGTDTTPVEEPAEEVIEPSANISPADIDSGYVPQDAYHATQPWNDDHRTSDIWWKDGQEGSEGIYLTDAANDAGKSVTWVDSQGYETDSQFDMEISADNHLVSQDDKEPAVDLVFSDALTCYDYATDTWYVRGNADELNALLEGLSAETENGKWSVAFGEDGAFSEVYDGEEGAGTWEFVTSCNVRLSYDTGLDPITLDVIRDADGNVTELADSWNHLLVK